jgi:hypothetical protein
VIRALTLLACAALPGCNLVLPDHGAEVDPRVTCAAGACACATGFGDCDNDPENGCEVNLAESAESCGACGHDCQGGACVDGACQPTAYFASADSMKGYFAVGSDGRIIVPLITEGLVSVSPGSTSLTPMTDVSGDGVDAVVRGDTLFYLVHPFGAPTSPSALYESPESGPLGHTLLYQPTSGPPLKALVGATGEAVYALTSDVTPTTLVRLSLSDPTSLPTTVSQDCVGAAVSADHLFYIDSGGLFMMPDGATTPTALDAHAPAALPGMAADGSTLYYATPSAPGPPSQAQVLIWEQADTAPAALLASLPGAYSSALGLDDRWVYLAVERASQDTLWRVPRDRTAGAPRAIARGVGPQLVRIQAVGSTLYWSYDLGNYYFYTGGVLELLRLPLD